MGCQPLSVGGVIRISYTENGSQRIQLFQGSSDTFQLLRPAATITNCEPVPSGDVPPPLPPPIIGPPATPAQLCSGKPIAPPLPTPAPANVPAKITLQVAPTFPPSPPQSALPAPGCVTLVVGGRQRASSDPNDMQNAIMGGASVLRADGSFAIIQSLTAPGWPPDNYLIDGNPITAVLGQGFMPGQLDLIHQLVAAGLTIPPTLAPGAPAPPLFIAPPVTPPVITGTVSGVSPLALVAGAVILFLLMRK